MEREGLEASDVLDAPVDEVREVDVPEVLDVLLEEASPRRVVVEVPSVLTVRVVVRAAPLELTRLLVVVEAGVTLRVTEAGVSGVLVAVVPLDVLEVPEELVCLVELEELDVLEVLEESDVLEVLEEPDVLEVLEEVDVLEVVVVVVVLLAATRFWRSRALVISAVRLEPVLPAEACALLAAAIRLEKFWSG